MTRILGDVKKHSRLYHYLKDRRLWKAARLAGQPELHVTRLGGSHDVYLITDGKSHKKFILKSFLSQEVPDKRSIRHMDKEYMRLKDASRIVSHRDWTRVARPLCKSEGGDFFAEEYVSGTSLGHFIREAILRGHEGTLYEKLTMLAGSLALLHKNSRKPYRVNPSSIASELKRHARQSSLGGAMTAEELREIKSLTDKACSKGFIEARKSLVHGDANPSNFLYGHGRVYVIDMERAGYKDPVYDLGTMAGELFHYAMYYGHDPYKADPFIGHLFWMYSGNHNDQHGTFMRLTKRNPLYMANSLLRIARHPFFSKEYKRRLAYHAKECLMSLK